MYNIQIIVVFLTLNTNVTIYTQSVVDHGDEGWQ